MCVCLCVCAHTYDIDTDTEIDIDKNAEHRHRYGYLNVCIPTDTNKRATAFTAPATEQLSEYLERDICADNLVDIKQKVQDKYR